MLLAVDGPVWDAAVVALAAGNHTTAGTQQRLAVALGASGGMAGSDASATAFSTSYDEAAQDAVDAVGRLVDAWATMARLTRASLDHHHRADSASTVWCGGAGVPVYDDAEPPAARELVSAAAYTVPASLGSDAIDLPAGVQWVLDRVEGFVWPDADVGRLRAAGRAWDAAAADLDELYRHCRTATGCLERQAGPEIPVAVTAVGNLDASVSGLSGHLRTIGRACAAYADDVETHRHQVTSLVAELLVGAAVVQGLGLVLGVVTAGMTAAGAAALNAARIAEKAPAILRIIDTLATLARSSAAGLRFVVAALAPITTTLERLASARVIGFAAHAVYRGEQVGLVNPAPLPPLPPGWKPTIDLCDHEGVGGHTVGKHVGKSDEWMRQRLDDSDLDSTSSFPDLKTAEWAIGSVISRQRSTLATWLHGTQSKLRLNDDVGRPIGRTVTGTGAHETSGIRVVLRRDAAAPDGYIVLTAFPDYMNEVP